MSQQYLELYNGNSDGVYVVLFMSRNKDNKDIPNYKQRRKTFITKRKVDDPILQREFTKFFEDGVQGEMCRMYYSVNARNTNKIHRELLHFLIDNPEYNLCGIESKISSIAAKKECANERRWLFDFDSSDTDKLSLFCENIKEIDNEIRVIIHKTPNGYAVITNRGFDIRKLSDDWNEFITLKKDDLLCVHWLMDINARIQALSLNSILKEGK